MLCVKTYTHHVANTRRHIVHTYIKNVKHDSRLAMEDENFDSTESNTSLAHKKIMTLNVKVKKKIYSIRT